MQPFHYAERTPPADYRCHDCGAHGCKLWREYQTMLEHQVLRCVDCAGRNQGRDVSDIDARGRRIAPEYSFSSQRTDTIGWLVPAVPTEDGDTYWGYSSVPQPGVDWWYALPNRV